jgi:hypothetical protein
MSDFSIYKQLEAARISIGVTGNGIANGLAPVAQSHTHEDRYPIANVSAAQAESPLGTSKYQANAIGATLHVSASFVANATDYNTLTLNKRTGAGAAVVMGTANLQSVAGTQFIGIPFTLVANSANTIVAAGDVLTLTNAKTGNGIANTPLGSVTYVLEDT